MGLVTRNQQDLHIVGVTERVLLRRFTANDVDLLYDLDSDPAVMRFLTGGRATPRTVIANEKLPHILRSYAQFSGFGTWAALERQTGVFLGWFSFGPNERMPPNVVELGYRLHQTAWGHGYATEVARALIDTGFAKHGVECVMAQTMTVNAASRRVMEKLGLRFVRTFFQEWPDQIAGGELGDVEYALTKAAWQEQQAASAKPQSS